jgi:hypothetical protein
VFADGVVHVRLVVCGIAVHSVPAGGEVDLSAKTVRAVLVGDRIGLGRGAAVVETDKAHGFARSGFGACLVALGRIASKHAEVVWESVELVVIRPPTLLVIDGHTASPAVAFAGLQHVFECAVLGDVVQLGCPVVGEILLDRTR